VRDLRAAQLLARLVDDLFAVGENDDRSIAPSEPVDDRARDYSLAAAGECDDEESLFASGDRLLDLRDDVGLIRPEHVGHRRLRYFRGGCVSSHCSASGQRWQSQTEATKSS